MSHSNLRNDVQTGTRHDPKPNIGENCSVEYFSFFFVFFWKVRRSFRSRPRSRNTICHVWSALGDRAVFVTILEALLVPKAYNFPQNLILKPMFKRMIPRTTITICWSQGVPKRKRYRKGALKNPWGVDRVIFVTQSLFCYLGQEFDHLPQGPCW